MGYDSELRCPEPIFVYPSGWSGVQFDKRVLQTMNCREVKNHSDFHHVAETNKEGIVSQVGQMFYTFEYKGDSGHVLFYPTDMEFYSKHYGTGLLAEIISMLIPKGQRTWLEFIGEDGARWGYAIESMNVYETEYEEYVYTPQGKFEISEWIHKVEPVKPPEEIKQIRKLNIPKGGQ